MYQNYPLALRMYILPSLDFSFYKDGKDTEYHIANRNFIFHFIWKPVKDLVLTFIFGILMNELLFLVY